MTESSLPDYYLHKWKKYLSCQDYMYLLQFVDNIRLGLENDKMVILCGESGTGKTTLQDDIYNYLVNDSLNNSNQDQILSKKEKIDYIIHDTTNSSSSSCLKIRQKFIFYFISDNNFFPRKNNKMFNVILASSWFKSKIAVTVDIKKVNNELLDISRIIKMEHSFTSLDF